MVKERLAILKLLERGIITPQEAEKLFLALPIKDDNSNPNMEEINKWICKTLQNTAEALGMFVKTCGVMAEEAAKEVEPFMINMAEVIAKTSSVLADEIREYVDNKKIKANETKPKNKN